MPEDDALKVRKHGNNEENSGEKKDMDILEFFSRDLDLDEKKKRYSRPGEPIGTNNFELDPDYTSCLNCKYMLGGCLQNVDSEKMELI